MSISLIGHESLELVPVLVFSFKSLDPKDSMEFSFSEKSLWFKGPLVEIKKKPGLHLFDIGEGKSSRAARSQASYGGERVLGRKRRLLPSQPMREESTHGLYTSRRASGQAAKHFPLEHLEKQFLSALLAR